MLQGQLYQRWYGRLRAQLREARVTQVRNVAWLIMGLFLSRSVHLEHIARKLPIRAKKLSLSRRLRRLLDNAAVRVRPWYEPTARWLLHNAGVSGEIRLIIDSTKVSARQSPVADGGGGLSPPGAAAGVDMEPFAIRP